MPRHAYIFLKYILAFSALMLCASALLFVFGTSRSHQHLAVLFLETPAGVLLLGGIGLAVLLDQAK